MRKVLVSSCGIATAALGAVALSAAPLKITGTVTEVFGDRSVLQGATNAGRIAQATPPAAEPGQPPADPNGQAPPTGPTSQAAADDPEDDDGPADDADDRPGEADDDRDGVDDAN